MGRAPRQRPISCKLCRQRKLRCSRVFPCSNCLCRGVECQHDGPAGSPEDSKGDISKGKDVSNNELLLRLEKLEAIIASHNGSSPVERPRFDEPVSSQPQSNSSPFSPQLQKITDDALFLERSCYGNALGESLVSDPIVFRICPIRKIVKQPSFIFQNQAIPTFGGVPDITKCIWIPLRQEARILLDKYQADVDHFHKVVHCQTLNVLVDGIYDRIEAGATPDIGTMVLLLCVITTATYGWSVEDDARLLFSDAGEARSQSIMWARAALDAIDHIIRIASASLECVQGMIILFLVFCNMEGLSTRARGIHNKCIAMARELGLHRLDSSSMAVERNNMGPLRAEISRRVWWVIVSTDWMMVHFGTTADCVSSIQPDHNAVMKPLNIDDEDLVDGKELKSRPLHEPTGVSAIIYRLKLAEICQGLVSRFPMIITHPDRLDYEYVRETDDKYRAFLRELPDFFQLDTPSTAIRPSVQGGIFVQRYMLNLMVHRNMCKLHLPYFARGAVDSSFVYSRDACLLAARHIIQAEKSLKSEGLPFSTTRLRSLVIIRSVFLASIVLVLNACLKSGAPDGDGDAGCLLDSWRILDEAQDQSATASKLLDLSMQVLRSHAPNHICLKNAPKTSTISSEPANRDLSKPKSSLGDMRQDIDSTYLNQQWQALEGRMDLTNIDWEKLFYGLDAPFV